MPNNVNQLDTTHLSPQVHGLHVRIDDNKRQEEWNNSKNNEYR